MGEAAQKNGWHLDKNVPIAIIGALIIQTAGVAWWAAQIDARVSALEAVATEMQSTRSALARIDEKLTAVKETVAELRRDNERRTYEKDR